MKSILAGVLCAVLLPGCSKAPAAPDTDADAPPSDTSIVENTGGGTDTTNTENQEPADSQPQPDETAAGDDESERLAVVYDCEDFSFYPQLSDEQNELINNLPVDELPKEAVDLSELRKNQIWRDTLVPLAADTVNDVTLYGAVKAEWLSEDTHQEDEILVNISNMDEALMVLRIGDEVVIKNVSWNKNAWNMENPWLAVADLDGDGHTEIAVCTYATSGMGTSYHQLWIYDRETFRSYSPIVSDLDVKYDADWDVGKVDLYSGPYTVSADEVNKFIPVDVNFISYGYIIDYSYDENRRPGQKLLCTTSLVCGDGGGVGYGRPFADVTAPIVFSNGQYRLGEVSDITLS